MSRRPRARVYTTPTADQYARSGERIIEYSFPGGLGGLISFSLLENGTRVVDLYRHDPGIIIRVQKVRPPELSMGSDARQSNFPAEPKGGPIP